MSDRTFHALQVSAKQPSGNAGVLISLAVPDDLQSLYTGSAGQHIVVRAHIEGSDVRRTYSLISRSLNSLPPNSPAGAQTLQIAVRVQETGILSRYLSTQIEPGDSLEVMPPTGSFQSRLEGPGRRAYVMLAAGSGITPVLAVLRHKLEKETQCTCTLLYGNQDTARALCLDEVLALKDRYLERLSLHFFMSREPQAQSRFNGRIDPARLQEFLTRVPKPQQYDECFVCVPSVMDGGLQEVLHTAGIPADRIHSESFTTAAAPSPVQSPTSRAFPDASQNPGSAQEAKVGVTVVMGGRRRTFVATPAQTLLAAGLAAGLDLPFSCCGGVCSTCRARVVEGEVEMAQNYALEDWELAAGFVLVCQSTALTPAVVLDYDAV